MRFKQHNQPERYQKEAEDREDKRKELSDINKSKKKKRYFFVFSLLILISAIIIYAIASRPDSSAFDPFINCLEEKEVKFYGSFQCPHCATQKGMFNNAKAIDSEVYVECGPLGGPISNECRTAGINSYPTWTFPNGDKLTGVIELEVLAEKSGCSLESNNEIVP